MQIDRRLDLVFTDITARLDKLLLFRIRKKPKSAPSKRLKRSRKTEGGALPKHFLNVKGAISQKESSVAKTTALDCKQGFVSSFPP